MNREQDRNRLVELIDNFFEKEIGASFVKGFLDKFADNILDDGWMRPPVKVGDKTFLLLEKFNGKYDIVESECWRISQHKWGDVYSMYFDWDAIGNSLEFESNDFGKTVFTSREEAEAKLKGGGEE